MAEEKMHRATVSMDDETFEAFKTSGRKLVDLVKRGLALEAADVRLAKAAADGPNDGDEIRAAGEEREALLSSFGRRIENLCAANEQLVTLLEREDTPAEQTASLTAAVTGLLTLLTSGYTLQRPELQKGETVITSGSITPGTGAPNTPPHAHTIDGPGDCSRCELLRGAYPLGQGYEDANHRVTAPPVLSGAEQAAWLEAEQDRLGQVAREVADDDGHGGPF